MRGVHAKTTHVDKRICYDGKLSDSIGDLCCTGAACVGGLSTVSQACVLAFGTESPPHPTMGVERQEGRCSYVARIKNLHHPDSR